jgi:membrane-associated phospholipid phosphatase
MRTKRLLIALPILFSISLSIEAAGQDFTQSQAVPALANTRLPEFSFSVREAIYPVRDEQNPKQAAQEERHESKLKAGFSRLLGDQAAIYKAPFQARGSERWWFVPFVVAGALIPADRHVSAELPRNNLSVSRRISDVGFYGSEAALGAFLLHGLLAHNQHSKETAYLGGEALLNSAIVYAVTNVVTGRQRPLVGNGHGQFFQDHSISSSFPSGHATFTWAAASTIAHEYPNPAMKFLWYGIATTVSVTRVTGQKHFPSDVLVGGTLGYLIALKIFHRHSKFQQDSKIPN